MAWEDVKRGELWEVVMDDYDPALEGVIAYKGKVLAPRVGLTEMDPAPILKNQPVYIAMVTKTTVMFYSRDLHITILMFRRDCEFTKKITPNP